MKIQSVSFSLRASQRLFLSFKSEACYSPDNACGGGSFLVDPFFSGPRLARFRPLPTLRVQVPTHNLTTFLSSAGEFSTDPFLNRPVRPPKYHLYSPPSVRVPKKISAAEPFQRTAVGPDLSLRFCILEEDCPAVKFPPPAHPHSPKIPSKITPSPQSPENAPFMPASSFAPSKSPSFAGAHVPAIPQNRMPPPPPRPPSQPLPFVSFLPFQIAFQSRSGKDFRKNPGSP